MSVRSRANEKSVCARDQCWVGVDSSAENSRQRAAAQRIAVASLSNSRSTLETPSDTVTSQRPWRGMISIVRCILTFGKTKALRGARGRVELCAGLSVVVKSTILALSSALERILRSATLTSGGAVVSSYVGQCWFPRRTKSVRHNFH